MDTRHETRIAQRKSLKLDALGVIVLESSTTGPRIVRDTTGVRGGLGWLARRLTRREHAALRRAGALAGVPGVHAFDGKRLVREYLPGSAMHLTRFDSRPYFKDALRLLRRLHRCGIAHNDLAKEANWICMPGDRAGIVDFQLALVSPRRSRLFRLLAREDLRHLLKHKRHYAPLLLTARQRRVLASPSAIARFWRLCVKPAYRLVTRKLLGWPERPDARERQWRAMDVE